MIDECPVVYYHETACRLRNPPIKKRSVSDKTELEKEREGKLFDQWMMMTEERNALLAPAANSGVPGAPASW